MSRRRFSQGRGGRPARGGARSRGGPQPVAVRNPAQAGCDNALALLVAADEPADTLLGRLRSLMAESGASPDRRLAEARLLLKLGRPGEAEAIWHSLSKDVTGERDTVELCIEVAGSDAHAALAERMLDGALARFPRNPALYNCRAVLLGRRGDREAAERDYLASLSLVRRRGVMRNYAGMKIAAGDPGKALELLLEAEALPPAGGKELIGLILLCAGRLGGFGAHAGLVERQLSRPDLTPGDFRSIVGELYNRRSIGDAAIVAARARQRFPDNSEMLRLHAHCLQRLDASETAVALLRGALARHPVDPWLMFALAQAYRGAFTDLPMANALYEAALTIAPGNAEILAGYCEGLENARYDQEGCHLQRCHEIACRLADVVRDPHKVAAAVQGIAMRMASYDLLDSLGSQTELIDLFTRTGQIGEIHLRLGRVRSIADRLQLVEAHRIWGREIEDSELAAGTIRHHPPQLPREKIRVALMSSDLRHHPVSYFAQPVIEGYDRNRFELYCYSFYPRAPDPTQQHFSKVVDRFRLLPHASDRQVAEAIAGDAPDILFELAGTTMHSRFRALCHRPAPVQVSWVGYPHSVGLPSISHILLDPWINPEDPRLLLEKPFLMPETWVSLGSLGFRDTPVDPGIPEQHNGFLTFGTLNNPYKLNRMVLETWAQILLQVPGSKFLFVRPESATMAFRDNIRAHFASHGVDGKRLLFLPARGRHLRHYNRIDIALDPFPHVGGTTTCETLWMGVPVVSLRGPAFFERLGYSNLNNSGLGDLCVDTREAYIRQAVTLAQDQDRRVWLRANLRHRMREHPIGQTERFVRHFETQIREVTGK